MSKYRCDLANHLLARSFALHGQRGNMGGGGGVGGGGEELQHRSGALLSSGQFAPGPQVDSSRPGRSRLEHSLAERQGSHCQVKY
jgi:hypothetical protein